MLLCCNKSLSAQLGLGWSCGVRSAPLTKYSLPTTPRDFSGCWEYSALQTFHWLWALMLQNASSFQNCFSKGTICKAHLAGVYNLAGLGRLLLSFNVSLFMSQHLLLLFLQRDREINGTFELMSAFAFRFHLTSDFLTFTILLDSRAEQADSSKCILLHCNTLSHSSPAPPPHLTYHTDHQQTVHCT